MRPAATPTSQHPCTRDPSPGRRPARVVTLGVLATLAAGCPPTPPSEPPRAPAAEPEARARRAAPGAADAAATPDLGPPLGRLLHQVTAAGADLSGLQQRIRQAATRAGKTDRAILRRLGALVGQMAGPAPPAPPELARQAAALARDVATAHPDDAATQIAAASTLFALATSLGGRPPGPALQAEALERYSQITRRFPDVAAGHYGLGHAVLYGRGDPLVGLRALKRCVQLEPTHPHCRAIHRLLTQRYTRPYCAGSAIPTDLRVHRAWTEETARPGGARVRPIAHQGETLQLQAAATLTAADIARVVTAEGGVRLELTDAAARTKLGAFTPWSAQQDRAVLMRGADLLAVQSAPPVRGGAALRLPAAITAVCPAVVHPTVPARLQLEQR